ncbi:hypothetical protein PCANC_01280 [Puccinia coronata f. sp. avenae]|uniref:DNA 3'-5' helicase n=1 Tax=Puccinia coronata f. sp. avenae TaxID=200324 RepID=A0A2N5W3W9_9BASI|nr:hypothetical protein PCANC_01280 [Puccinia coronata f. sp. avenae]
MTFAFRDDSQQKPVGLNRFSSNINSNSKSMSHEPSTKRPPPSDHQPTASIKKPRPTPPIQTLHAEATADHQAMFPDECEIDFLEQLHQAEHSRSSKPSHQQLNPTSRTQAAPMRPSNSNNSTHTTPSDPDHRPAPSLPTRAYVEPSIQEMDLETLYNKRHTCISKIVVTLENMLSIFQTGECSTGDDLGCLAHTKAYLDGRLAEFNAEVKRRQSSENNALEASKSSVALIHTNQVSTHTINRVAPIVTTSPSPCSRLSNENLVLAVKPLPSSEHHTPKITHRSVSDNIQSSIKFQPNNSASKPAPLEKPVASTSLLKTYQPSTSVNHSQRTLNQAEDSCRDDPVQEASHNSIDPDLFEGIFSADEEEDEPVPYELGDDDPDILDQTDHSLLHAPSGSIDIIRPITSKTSTNPSHKSNATQNAASITHVPPPEEDLSKKMNHPWSRDVGKALVHVFKLRSWRHNQIDAINTTLSGKDCFVLMPTGGGKSLCYQLPAVVRSGVTKGVTIVISPLISLITDQVQALCAKHIGAAAFTGTMTSVERDYVTNDLRSVDPALCLVYVTPEMIMKSEYLYGILTDLHNRKLLARFVFDEAHCVSQWGHDFRPDYKGVGPKLRKDFKNVPFIALTATANHQVQQDVMSNLKITGCRVLTQSFNRANLRYEVRPKTKDVLQDLIRIITVDHHGESGIVYCLSKKQCEEVAAHLSMKNQVKAHHYHAGMSKDDRQKIQQGWQVGKLQVICATIAFGMGIDKPDVRFVVHHSMPSSLEGYYQETGRAGRDGQISECILFYAYRDYTTFMRMVEKTTNSRDQVERQQANAKKVVGFCLNKVDCRRSLILSYFGEKFSADRCGKTCDTCMNPEKVVKKDVSQLMKAVVKLVKQITADQSESVTIAHMVDVFRGSKSKKVTTAGHDRLEGAGQGSVLDRTDCERLLHLMVSDDILNERFESNAMGFTNAYVQLGSTYRQFLNSQKPVMMHFNAGVAGPSKRSAPAEPPKKVTIRSRKGGEKEASGMEDSGSDVQVDDSIDQDTLVSVPRATSSQHGPPVRGAVKQQALASLKAKRQLNEIKSTGNSSAEDCYNALLLLKDALSGDDDEVEFPTQEVLQTIACLHPTSMQELGQVEGFSKRCLDQYGQPIMRVLNKFNTHDSATQNKSGPQEGKSTNLTTNRPVDFQQHLSKYAASNKQQAPKPSANPKNKSTNNFKKFVPRTAGSGSAAIKPMPIPR